MEGEKRWILVLNSRTSNRENVHYTSHCLSRVPLALHILSFFYFSSASISLFLFSTTLFLSPPSFLVSCFVSSFGSLFLSFLFPIFLPYCMTSSLRVSVPLLLLLYPSAPAPLSPPPCRFPSFCIQEYINQFACHIFISLSFLHFSLFISVALFLS